MAKKKPNPTPDAPAQDDAPLKHEFLWVDLETTGLDPKRDKILECAIVLADDAPGGDFSEVMAEDFVVRFDYDSDDLAPYIDPYVVDMHAKNGLWVDCAGSETTIGDLDEMLVMFAQEQGAKVRSIVLAGASVHFDLAFLREHCPRFSAYLSHRVHDCSTLKLAARAAFGEQVWPRLTHDSAVEHRALPDIRASLADAARFRAEFMRGASS